jgi:hypothetical protein
MVQTIAILVYHIYSFPLKGQKFPILKSVAYVLRVLQHRHLICNY